MSIRPGQRYRLLADHGNPPLHLRAGSVGTVREVVPADVVGAHNDYEDAVILEFEGHEVGYDEAGVASVRSAPRAAAFAISDLDPGAGLFEVAE